ncbi:MAG TPA: ROK family protein [Terriglobales bacterium]|nr:ROK family protein [Terriglobales bacterium]
MNNFAIGVDLGGTNLRIAAVDESGKILDAVTTGTEVARGRDSVIDEMCAAIQELSARFSVDKKLTGIGIGVPGIIDLQRGMLRESPNLPGWHDFPVQKEIEKRLGTHVVLENDANAAAYGEYWLGAGRDHQGGDLCMITLGTGVGGGLILGGKVHHGMTGMAGELGHVTVYPDGHACGCGNHGCLEQYASATAVKRMVRERIAQGNAPLLEKAMKQFDEVSPELVFRLAMAGDGESKEIFAQVGQALGTSIAGWINALNVRIYVIGGGVSGAWDAFAPTMMAEIGKRSFVYRATTTGKAHGTAGTTVVTRAVLGGDAGLLGSARLAMLRS